MKRTLLKNAVIIDGVSGPSFKGQLLIAGDQIEAVLTKEEPEPSADTVLDVAGSVVAPGFIDMHSHIDWVMPLQNHATLLSCLLEQGITTVVAGNCGISVAPVHADRVRRLEAMALIAIDAPLRWEWSSTGEFLEVVNSKKPAVNLAQLVGHAAVRTAVTETKRGPMTPDEQSRCLHGVRQAFDEGACGLSFGLGYDPGMYSTVDEITAFCEVAAAAGKPAVVHLKAYSKLSPCYPLTYLGAHNVRALREMLDIGRRTGVTLQLSHFLFVGRKSWPYADKCLGMVTSARQQGLDVMIDAFPYTCGNTTVNALLPYWYLRDLRKAYRSRWARARLGVELGAAFRLLGFDLNDMQVMNAGVEGWEDLNGLRIQEVARRWKLRPLDALLRFSQESDGGTLALFHTYSGEAGNEFPLESVLSQDYCLFETDAVIRSGGFANPAALGTFPRILGEFCRTRKLFSLEDAIRRMTFASAQRFGLADRGSLEPGKAADIVVFDPERIADVPPHGFKPAQKPIGIEHVFVNGTHVVRNGRFRGECAGQAIVPL